eukprot:CAMPEP_0175101214 /NCGR_PEP_ID=MMETSP0086_2-20121207/7640_1 /TAXON_ID=136419 /ORGANISM="Unknown Unknown, Strain D1" /LENGTH=481 /DNA_ID=CAMNT_0016375655 /DNA_START=186 /DNA_END=1631 /DNA_ORIENTATION=-
MATLVNPQTKTLFPFSHSTLQSAFLHLLFISENQKRQSTTQRQQQATGNRQQATHHTNLACKGITGGITDDDCKEIGPTPAENSTITVRKLGRNNIGLKALSDTLKANSTITELDLWGNQIGYQGMLLLSDALKENVSFVLFHEISLFDVYCHPRLHIRSGQENSTINKLDLALNDLGNLGMLPLSDVLKANSTITALGLVANRIGDTGMILLSAALKANDTLLRIDVRNNSGITIEGARLLTCAVMGRKVVMEVFSKIPAKAILANDEKMTKLGLSLACCGVTEACVLAECLKANNKITELNLRANKIGFQGMIPLSQTLKENSTITELDLRDNQIGFQGMILLSEALRENKTVTKLDLDNNDISAIRIGPIRDILCRNRGIQAVTKLQLSEQGTLLDLSQQDLGFEGISYFAREGLIPAIMKKVRVLLPAFHGEEALYISTLINSIVLPPTALNHQFPAVISRIIADYDSTYRKVLNFH